MLFDFLLVVLLILFFFKTSAKATLDSFLWILGAFITIRISGSFYLSLAEMLQGFFPVLDSRTSQYVSYVLLIFIVSAIYIFILRGFIAKIGRYIPKKMLISLSFLSNILMGFMLFVIIYATANSFPIIGKLPPRVRNARTEILVVWTLGDGSVEFIRTMRNGLNEFDNPLDYLRDKQKLLNSNSQK